MTDNDRHLADTRAQVKAFQTGQEPERLRQAYQALGSVDLARETDPAARTRMRAQALALWLGLVALVDRLIDPAFDPEDVPEEGVYAPPTAAGVVYPPGADPALIDDPKARAQYEQAIAANRQKAQRYRLQSNLRRLDERISARADAFIRYSYTFAPADREEAKAAILKIVKNPRRQAPLLRACYELD